MNVEWPEDRIDYIGQNGNDGLHYEENNMTKRLGPPSPYDYDSDWDYYDALEQWEDEINSDDDYIPEDDS